MYRPVILIGAGCPRSLAADLGDLGIPILVTWQGIDRIPEDHPSFCGRPGVIGQRAANIIQQMATDLQIFGARMDQEQIGHRIDLFAPGAKITVFDVDPPELDKFPDDWKRFIMDLSSQKPRSFLRPSPKWLQYSRRLYDRFRPELEGDPTIGDHIDPYYFTRRLSEVLQDGEILVPGSSGMQSCALMQAFKVKRDQRIILCNTIGAMGLEPMAIGAAVGSGKRVICVTGDGGFFLNFQELETVRRLDLNIKYFVFCNGGYGSISSMQDQRFGLRVGADPGSGFTLPDLERTAAVWGISFHDLKNSADLDSLQGIINADHASIVRINSSMEFRYACKVQSTLVDGRFVNDPMEDMSPKIPDLRAIMEWQN